MADNKKKKLDFASALRALADKIDEEPKAPEEPKSDPKEETLGITINGKFTQLVRGDMTEEAWNKLKDASERQSAFRERKRAKEDAEAAPTKPEELQLQGDRKVAPTEKPLKPLPPKRGGDEPEDQWQNPFPERTEAKPRTVGDLELQSSAGPGMSVRGNMEQMALGATPPPGGAEGGPGSPAPTDPVVPENQFPQPVSAALGEVDARVFGDKPLVPGGLGNVPRAMIGGTALNTGRAISAAGSALGMPNMQAAGANIQGSAAQVLSEGQAPAPGAEVAPAAPAAVATDTAVAPVPPPGMGGGGGFAIAGVDPALVKESALRRKQAIAEMEDAKTHIKAASDARETLIDSAAKEERLMQAEIAKNARLATEAQLTSVQEARKYFNAASQLAQDARDAASTPTDPNRYWNNKDMGQKAMAVIAGALFGATGQGMQWLQRLDGLVENDMKAQMSDRAAKVAGIEAQGRVLGEAGQRALQLGASEAQAHLLERSTKLEGLKSYLEMMQLQLTVPEQKMKAAEMMATLGQHVSQLADEGYKLGEMSAQRVNEARYRQAELQAKEGSQGGMKLTTTESERLVAAQAAWDAVPGLEAALGSGKTGDALLDEIQKHFPGTSAANRDQQAKLLGRAIFAGIDKSVVNASDQGFLDKLQSGVGLRSMSRGDLEAYKRLIKASYNAVLKTASSRASGTLQPLGGPGLVERPYVPPKGKK